MATKKEFWYACEEIGNGGEKIESHTVETVVKEPFLFAAPRLFKPCEIFAEVLGALKRGNSC